MFAVLATLLAASPMTGKPPEATVRTGVLRARVDFVGLITSSWYVPQSRINIEAALHSLSRDTLSGEGVLLAAPVFGPWMTAGQSGPLTGGDRALLYTTGILQLVGLSLGAMHLFEKPGPRTTGPVLSVSPISAGRIGLSVRIVGF
ncbi:MAG: hypothetical protein Q8K32_02200 [Archangium sp.]|nr:hypothetical protein [Archangium sp.]